jgi:uncharacterized membrane protein (DUF485 family)
METEMTELSGPVLLNGTAPSPTIDAPVSAAPRTVLHSHSFRRLMSAKRRVVVPLLGASLAYTFGVALLSGFAPGLMATKIAGSFTLGYLLVLAIYGACWVVSVAYVCIANRTFEPQAQRVSNEFRGDAR